MLLIIQLNQIIQFGMKKIIIYKKMKNQINRNNKNNKINRQLKISKLRKIKFQKRNYNFYLMMKINNFKVQHLISQRIKTIKRHQIKQKF